MQHSLQIAMWELVTDATPSLSTGIYRYNQTAGIVSLANGYLADAAGKNESAIYLKVNHPPSTSGQGMLAPGSSISGKKFEDHNGNGFVDGADAVSGLAGWHILVNGVDSATTDATGAWSVGNLLPGTYTVQEVSQTGWTRTFGDRRLQCYCRPWYSNHRY